MYFSSFLSLSATHTSRCCWCRYKCNLEGHHFSWLDNTTWRKCSNVGDKQWCSGKYLFGGTHGERGARAYNRGLGAEPPAGSRGRAPGGGQRAKPPEAEKVLRFGHAMETANLPYNSLYFGNWVNRCYSWYLSKTEVQSPQWSPGAKQLCLRGQKLFVLNSTNMRDEQIQQAARKQSLQFPCALCHI